MSNYSVDSSLSLGSYATNSNNNNENDDDEKENNNQRDTERTSVLYGAGNVINAELKFFSASKNRIDTCMNYTRPHLAIALDPIRNSLIDAKNRGVKDILLRSHLKILLIAKS